MKVEDRSNLWDELIDYITAVAIVAVLYSFAWAYFDMQKHTAELREEIVGE